MLTMGPSLPTAIVESLLETFGVHVRTGAVRHPQSQGSAERFNRTLLTMIRKVIEDSSTWKADLDFLLFYYRNRPHSSTGFAPIEAMIGWKPNQVVVQSSKPTVPLSAWVQELTMRTARIRDLVDAEMSTLSGGVSSFAHIRLVIVCYSCAENDARSACRRSSLGGMCRKLFRHRPYGFGEHHKRRQLTWHSSSLTCLATQQSVCPLAKTVVCLQYLEWNEKFVVHRRCTSR